LNYRNINVEFALRTPEGMRIERFPQNCELALGRNE
jgi:hypothetical protein